MCWKLLENAGLPGNIDINDDLIDALLLQLST